MGQLASGVIQMQADRCPSFNDYPVPSAYLSAYLYTHRVPTIVFQLVSFQNSLRDLLESVDMSFIDWITIALAFCPLSHPLVILKDVRESEVTTQKPLPSEANIPARPCSHDPEIHQPVTAWSGDSW